MALGIWALQFTPGWPCRRARCWPKCLRRLACLAGWSGCASACSMALPNWVPAWPGRPRAWRRWLVRHGGGRVPEEALASRLDALPLQAMTAVGQHQATLARVGCRTRCRAGAPPAAWRAGAPVWCSLAGCVGPSLRPAARGVRLDHPASVLSGPAGTDGAGGACACPAVWRQAPAGADGGLAGCAPLRRAAFTLPGTTMPCAPGRQAMGGAHSAYRPAHAKRGACMRLLAEHLAQVVLAAPVGELELSADTVEPWAGTNHTLLPDPQRQGRASTRRLNASGPPGPAGRVFARALRGCRPEWMQHWHSDLAHRPRQATAGSGMPLPPGCWRCRCVWRNASTGRTTRGRCNCCWGLTVWRVVGGTAAARDAQALNVQRDYWLARSPMPACCGCFSSDWRGPGGVVPAWVLWLRLRQ
jgi:protein ImuB